MTDRNTRLMNEAYDAVASRGVRAEMILGRKKLLGFYDYDSFAHIVDGVKTVVHASGSIAII